MVKNAALLDGFNPTFHITDDASIKQALHKKTDDRTESILPTTVPTQSKHAANYLRSHLHIYLFHCIIFCFGMILGKLLSGSLGFYPKNQYNTHTSLVNNELVYWPLPQGYDSVSVPIQRNVTQLYFLNVLRSNMIVNGGFLDVFFNTTYAITSLETVTPQQFLNFSLLGKPILLPKHAQSWKASSLWTSEQYLRKHIGNVEVQVETSHNDVFSGDFGTVKKTTMAMNKFFDQFSNPDVHYYLAEHSIKSFHAIRNDFPNQPSFISKNFKLDKTQIWMGAGNQITPLHNDLQENIFCQIMGSRQITLYDPLQSHFLYLDPDNRAYAQVDPDQPNYDTFPLFKYATPIQVQLSAGDCIYIPGLWYHYIKSGQENNIAINWWYTSTSDVTDFVIYSTTSVARANPHMRHAFKFME